MHVTMGPLESRPNIWTPDHGAINFFFINIYMYSHSNHVHAVLLDLHANRLSFKKKYLVIL